ncbi:protein SMAX1-LIKE 4 [Tanacetum coccineum]
MSTTKPSTVLPFWLHPFAPSSNYHKENLIEMHGKWNKLCQSLHRGRHNVNKRTCGSVQKLLSMIIKLDSSKKSADMDGLTTRIDGTRTMATLRIFFVAKKNHLPTAQIHISLKDEIMQLEKRLQDQVCVREALEQALGYGSSQELPNLPLFQTNANRCFEEEQEDELLDSGVQHCQSLVTRPLAAEFHRKSLRSCHPQPPSMMEESTITIYVLTTVDLCTNEKSFGPFTYATVNLECKLHLRAIALEALNAQYNTEPSKQEVLACIWGLDFETQPSTTSTSCKHVNISEVIFVSLVERAGYF